MNPTEEEEWTEQIHTFDWDDYAKWLDRDRPWWYYLELENNWINRQENENGRPK